MSGELVNSVVEYLRGSYNASEIIVVEAPPGYGKSTSVPLLASELHEIGVSRNLIHVLPLRAIISDIYRNFYLAAFDPQKSDARLKIAREAFERMGVGEGDVAYQMCMDLMFREYGSGNRLSIKAQKSPAFDARAIVTTLDSFAYNMMRVPVIDSFRSVKRYAILRARILASSVFLDEAHMILRYPEDESTGKMLCFLRKLIEYSLSARIPLVVMSATLGSVFKQKLVEWSNQRLRIFTLGQEWKKEGRTLVLKDANFLDWAKKISWKTELTEEEKVVEKAKELVYSGKRVLIVRDSVRKAMESYRALKDEVNAVLIHGQLTLRDRTIATHRIEELQRGCSRGFAVVATPVVEAGVNWDFDAAFRDATNTFSLVQVAGRVCRRIKDPGEEGEVYLITHEGSNRRLVNFVSSVNIEGSRIDWRIPFDYNDGGKVYGYERIIDLQEGLDRLHEEGVDVYEVLFFAFMLPSRNISALEEEMNYSLLREPLTHFFVGRPEDLRDSELGEIVDRTVTYGLSLLRRLQDKIRGFAAVGIYRDESGKYLGVEVLTCKEAPKEERDYSRMSKELIRKLVAMDAEPLLTCYILDEGAYEEGIGFRFGG
ncbi:MAG: CRISPR-associated helicase Cas3' [Thermofilum sp.]